MRTSTHIIVVIFIVFITYSCKQSETEYDLVENETAQKKEVNYYGIRFEARDSLSVHLNLDDFETYKELVDRAKQIACSNRIPKITLENEEEIKKIYFVDNCNELPIKVRNIINIYEDKVGTYLDRKEYPLDSLENYISRNINNYGKIDALSSNPELLRFHITYNPENDPKKLQNTLFELTKAFDKVGGNNVLKIQLLEKIEMAPPPPPPAPEVIEVVEDEAEIEEIIIENTETGEDEEVVEVVEVSEVIEEKSISDLQSDAVSIFMSLRSYMRIEGSDESNFKIFPTSSGQYRIELKTKVNEFVEDGVNHGLVTIDASVPLDDVDDLYMEDNTIYMESEDDNFSISVKPANEAPRSHKTYEFQIQIEDRNKRNRVYEALKTLVKYPISRN